jgi:hypothetical protein
MGEVFLDLLHRPNTNVLPTSEVVRQVVLGTGGIAEGATAGLYLVDTTTLRPKDSVRLAEELTEPGLRFLDAAVSGTSAMARQKDLVEDKNFSATRPCGSKGIGDRNVSMKLCVSSSGCKTCPVKGEPARAGSQPCDGVRNGLGDASAGERAGRGTAAPQPLLAGCRACWNTRRP